MHADHEAALFDTYPEIFRDRALPPSQSLMCFGFDCPDTWYPLLDALCAQFMQPVVSARRALAYALEAQAQVNREYGDEYIVRLRQQLADAEAQLPVAVQVKEKFAGLRFYCATEPTEFQRGAIALAERMSLRICQDCGTTVDVETYEPQGWWRALCPTCCARREQAALSSTELSA